MKTLTTRSATLAACTALLVAGIAGPASAAGTDEPSGSNIVVKGDSNNVAGNDLLVGDNNTSGTGHSIGQPQDNDVAQATVNIYNCTGRDLFLVNVAGNPSTSGEWLSPQATPPTAIGSNPVTRDGNQCVASGVSANWTSATTGLLTSNAIYGVVEGTLADTIQFSVVVDGSTGAVAPACLQAVVSNITCAWITSSDDPGIAAINYILVPA
ncbi:hypothetical protein [Streptomyces osmaniensis]|uniref:Secreted protein n=1 Tax=Streptomyces osmaniensis TaxID=593134 RepID=A0ABP6YZM7_9ACTN